MTSLPRRISNEELSDLLMSRIVLAACPVPHLTDDGWKHLRALFEKCDDPIALAVIDWAMCHRLLSLAAERAKRN